MDYVSFAITEETKNKIEDFYKSHQDENNGEYIVFFARYENTTVTIYQSKKGYKVTFAGDNALYEAKIFNPEAKVTVPKEKVKTSFLTHARQIGSDEVGFGDFFGPLIVVAAYYDSSLGDIADKIDDSKKLSDDFILEFVPTILDKVTFSKLTVRNEKYNDTFEKGINMLEMKARLHNCALNNVSKKKPECRTFFIDQFCEPDLYYSYVRFEPEVVEGITFRTKGESHYPSVALASMIARYYFLKEMEALNEKYMMEFPKGASLKVDEFIKEFIKKYSKSELRKVAKLNFANYKNIK